MTETHRSNTRLRLLKPISKSLTDVPDLVAKIQKLSQDAILEKYNNKIKGSRKQSAQNKFHEVVKNYADIALYEIHNLENKATKKQGKLFVKARDMIRQLYIAAIDFEITTVITTTTLSNSSEHKGGSDKTNSYFLNLIKIVILAYIAYYAVIAVQDPIYYDTLYNQVCKTNETVTEEVIPKNILKLQFKETDILKLQFKETVRNVVKREPTCSDIFEHFFHDTYNLIAATVILFSIVFCIKNTKDILGLSNDAAMDLTVNTVRIGTSLYATKNDIKRIQEENRLRKQNNLVNAFGGYGAALLAVATGRYGEALGKTVEATKEFRDSFQDFGHKERIEKAKLNFVNEAVDIMSRSNPIRKAINNESEKPYTASAFVVPADLPKPPPARVERKTSPQHNATPPSNQPQTKPKSKSPELKPKSKSPELKPRSKSPESKPKSKSPEPIKKVITDDEIEVIIRNVCTRAYGDEDEIGSCETTLTMYFDIDDNDERMNRFVEVNDMYMLDDDDEFLTALGHLETAVQAGLGGAKQKKRKYKRRT